MHAEQKIDAEQYLVAEWKKLPSENRCRVKTGAEWKQLPSENNCRVKTGAEQKTVAEQYLVTEWYCKDLVAELSKTQYVPSISKVSWVEQCSISACKFVTLQTLM